MPFAFKLSRRLARIRCTAFVLATAALAACEKSSPSVTGLSQPVSQVVQILVSPNAILLFPTQSQQFAAYARTAAGDSTTVAVTWSATAGTISPSGLYTPGPAGGVYEVRATATQGGPSGVASVTVSDGPPPSSGSWPNEPAGFSLISDYGFGDVIPVTNDPIALGSSGWQAQWNTAGNGTLIADAGAPVSLGGVYQVRYPMGFVDGTAPSTVEHPLPSRPTELYWGVWWKPSNPFQSDASGVNKIAFIWTPSGNTDLIYFDLSPNPWRIRAMDDLYAGGGPDAGKRDEPNVTTTVITLGQWHRIEIYVKYSTGANADGILKWWVDGVLNGTYTNLKMVQDGGFNSVSFSPTYGGAGGDVKTETDYYWFDHTRLSRP